MQVPDEAVHLAAEAIMGAQNAHDGEAERIEAQTLARVALEAAAPILAEAVAQKILAHMEEHAPPLKPGDDAMSLTRRLRRSWHRYFGIAARIAAGAFYTREDELRLAAEAIGRGDFIACDIPEVSAECPESKMDDGSHATDYEDSGSCPWCGERNPGWREAGNDSAPAAPVKEDGGP